MPTIFDSTIFNGPVASKIFCDAYLNQHHSDSGQHIADMAVTTKRTAEANDITSGSAPATQHLEHAFRTLAGVAHKIDPSKNEGTILARAIETPNEELFFHANNGKM